MKYQKKIKKVDMIFISIIVGLLLLIAIIYLYQHIAQIRQIQKEEASITASIEESRSIEESERIAYSTSIQEARARRPESSLTSAEIAQLDNTDQEFWFEPVVPYSKDRPVTIPSIADEMSQPSVIWLEKDQPVVYLTMDLGYEYNDNVSKILDIAKKHHVPINFFLTGDFLNSEPEKVIRMYEEGHMIGNHTVSHRRAPELIEESFEAYAKELHDLEEDFTQLTGGTLAPYIRPPYGAFSERTIALNESLGYYTVFWSFAHMDWDVENQPDPTETLDYVMSQAHNGEILLLHTISNTNVEILDNFFTQMLEQGYSFKRLDERE